MALQLTIHVMITLILLLHFIMLHFPQNINIITVILISIDLSMILTIQEVKYIYLSNIMCICHDSINIEVRKCNIINSIIVCIRLANLLVHLLNNGEHLFIIIFHDINFHLDLILCNLNISQFHHKYCVELGGVEGWFVGSSSLLVLFSPLSFSSLFWSSSYAVIIILK